MRTKIAYGTVRVSAAVLALLISSSILPAQEACQDRLRLLERKLAEQGHALKDWAGLIRYGSDDAELAPANKGENRAVFLGDQITEFWGRNAQFFTGKPWINRGVAGQTTDQMLVRFRQDVIALHPKVVVILAGLNDIAGLHGSATEEMILDNLTSMTELAQVNGIRVVLASLTPVCDCFKTSTARQRWQERIMEVNDLMRKYSASSGAVFLDYYSAMSGGGKLKMNLTSDGVLPNDAGYAVMAPLAEKAITEALKK